MRAPFVGFARSLCPHQEQWQSHLCQKMRRIPTLVSSCFPRHPPFRQVHVAVSGGGPSAPVDAAGSLQRGIERQITEFRSMYGHSGSDVQALVEWMQTYYRRPRPDLLLGALAVAASIPGALTGEASFPAAVFLSHVVPRLQDEAQAITAVQALTLAATVGSGPDDPATSTRTAELMETMFRAMYFANLPAFDAALESAVSESAGQTRRSGHDNAEELAVLAESVFPPGNERVRVPLLEWPIPAMSLSVFELHVTRSRFPVYAASRYLFSGTHAAFLLGKRGDRMQLTVLLPHVAAVVTNSMIDGLWSCFYATGNPAPVLRVLDVGTAYVDFMEEYGFNPVNNYAKETDARGGRPAVSIGVGWEKDSVCHEDPYNRMRFETSRYALWTLCTNASSHSFVGEVLLTHAAKMEDQAAMHGPFGADEVDAMTTHGRAQLRLLKMLRTTFTSLHLHATEYGVGSGQWPASYSASSGGAGGSSAPALLSADDTSGGLHSLPAVDSEPPR